MGTFLDRPQTVPWRRALFTVHLWLGIAIGLYLFIISVTGALLVFRIDMQRALYPDLLEPQTTQPTVDAAAILRSLESSYPGARILGVDAPTLTRPVYLAYVSGAPGFHTVLADPGTAQVLGELPAQTPLRILQDLHFNLLLGDRGAMINGIGALCLLTLCLTGAVIWWQGRKRWTRGIKVRTGSGAAQFNWDLHSATGFWMFGLIVMWALTALNFTFPRQFRSTLEMFSSITPPATVSSSTAQADVQPPSWETLIARAQAVVPDQFVARVVLPRSTSDAFQVYFAERQPTPTGPNALTPVYVDRYSGELIAVPPAGEKVADVILRWAAPLHIGSFGGTGSRIAWFFFGLAPATLFVTGFLSWWRRIVRPARARYLRSGSQPQGDPHVGVSVE